MSVAVVLSCCRDSVSAEFPIDNRLEDRHVVLNDFPHPREIDLLAGMGGDVSEAVHLPPWNGRMPCLEAVRELPDGVRQRFEAAKDGVLDDRLTDKNPRQPPSVPIHQSE